MLPDESAGEIEVELRSLVAGLSARDPDFRATVRGLGSRPAYEISPDAPIVQLVSNCDSENSRFRCAQSSSSEWRHGRTQLFSPQPVSLESFSALPDEASTEKRSTWS